MPLITCPDCQQSVSDQAPSCPKCGRPMQARVAEVKELKTDPGQGLGVGTIALGVGCGIILAPFLFAGLTCGGCAMLAGIGSLGSVVERMGESVGNWRPFNDLGVTVDRRVLPSRPTPTLLIIGPYVSPSPTRDRGAVVDPRRAGAGKGSASGGACPDWDDINVRIAVSRRCAQQCAGDDTVSEDAGICFEKCVRKASCGRSHVAVQ